MIIWNTDNAVQRRQQQITQSPARSNICPEINSDMKGCGEDGIHAGVKTAFTQA
jgi:hypothetical protein